MKSYLLFVISLVIYLLPQVVVGQPAVADSLLRALELSRADSTQVYIYKKLVRLYINQGNSKEAMKYAAQSLALSRKLKDEPLVAVSLYSLGYAYQNLDDVAKSRHFFNQSVLLAKKLGDKPLLAENYRGLGILSYKEGLLNQALVYYQQGVRFAKESGNQLALGPLLSNIGLVFKLKGDDVKAINYYLQALRIGEAIKDTYSIADYCNNIGSLYRRQGNLVKAREYYFRALKISTPFQNRTLAHLFNNIGNVYEDEHDYPKAILYFTKAREVYERIGNVDGVIASLANTAGIYQEIGALQKALETNIQALQIAEQGHNLTKIVLIKSNIGATYLELKDYRQALRYVKQSLKLAQQLGLQQEIKINHEHFCHIYTRLGKYQQALYHYQLYTQYKDSLLNETNVRKVTELNLQYETEKKEQQIKVLSQQAQIQQLQISQQRFYLIASTAFVLLLLLFGYLFIRQRELKNYHKTTELEQKLLVAQLNPHFIFNSLIAIQNFMFKNTPLEAGKYLAKFAKLMRLILESSRQPYIELSKEIQTLTYYFEMQQLRFQQSFDYQIYIDPQLNPEQVLVPPMFVQPLVENALEHGLLHKAGKGIIKVQYLLKGDKLLLEVEDNGVGQKEAGRIKQATQPEFASLATKITQERLAIVNRYKNRKIDFTVVDVVDVNHVVQGTKATFFIPFKPVL